MATPSDEDVFNCTAKKLALLTLGAEEYSCYDHEEGSSLRFTIDWSEVRDSSWARIRTSSFESGYCSPQVPEDISCVERQLFDEIRATKSPSPLPPKCYICHSCYQKGHFVRQCPKVLGMKDTTLTPYQGEKECYGVFSCHQCKRKWQSFRSYANTGQKCTKCNIMIFPKKQLPIKDGAALTSRRSFQKQGYRLICKKVAI